MYTWQQQGAEQRVQEGALHSMSQLRPVGGNMPNEEGRSTDLEGISFRLVLQAAVLAEHAGQALDGSACQRRNILLAPCAQQPTSSLAHSGIDSHAVRNIGFCSLKLQVRQYQPGCICRRLQHQLDGPVMLSHHELKPPECSYSCCHTQEASIQCGVGTGMFTTSSKQTLPSTRQAAAIRKSW